MRPTGAFEFPPEQAGVLKRAVRLECITVFYIVSSSAFMFLAMGGSQAMRTSFFEDAFSIVPSLAFLAGTWIVRRPPTSKHPYGFHGAVSIGYLTSAFALLALGMFLLFEAVTKLILVERTTIGGIELFDHVIWAGWPMLVALAYSSIPAIFIGRRKVKLAPQINDKVLYAGADMMRADWMTEMATAVGVIGVGFGVWWLDPVAAVLVSFAIARDGATNLWIAVNDLIQRRPMMTDRSELDPLPDRLRECVSGLEWVQTAEVRLRESGHVYFGEVFVVPVDGTRNLPERISAAIETTKSMDWRLHDLTFTLIRSLDGSTVETSESDG